MTSSDLKKLRKSHGLTQVQAAELAMVGKRHWQKMESGEKPMIPRTAEILLRRLSDYLDGVLRLRTKTKPKNIEQAGRAL